MTDQAHPAGPDLASAASAPATPGGTSGGVSGASPTPRRVKRPPRARRKGLPTFLHGPAALAVRTAVSVPLVAGVAPSVRAAGALARFYAGLPFNAKRLRRAREHLEIAFPEMAPERRAALAVAAYEHLFRLGVEISFAPRLITRDAWARHMRLADIRPAVKALTSDRPCVLVTGHVGNWELIGYAIAMLGFPVHAVYRPLDLKPLDRWVRRTRETRGLSLVSKFGAVRDLPPILERREPVGLVADQNGGDRGIFVPFFGRLTSSYKSVAFLAMRSRATVVCGMARRLPDGELRARDPGSLGYQVESFDVFGPEDWEKHPDPPFYITARYRRAIEMMVRSAPEQYLWMHRIWRSRPAHERFDKPFPPALAEKLRTLPWMTEAELARVMERSERDRALVRAGATF